MKVLRANALGMCFGVRDALNAIRSLGNPADVTVYGELVHNPAVIRDLENRGFHQVDESRRNGPPPTPAVLITAHGVSNSTKSVFNLAGKQLIDTTCPLVRRLHDTAVSLHEEGWFVVVAGSAKHVEVQGVVGDLSNFAVAGKAADVIDFGQSRIAIVAQTTMPPPEAQSIVEAVRIANPQAEIRWVDTICRPTRERISAVADMACRVDAVVVIGGKHSNNTLRLVELARQYHVPVQHIETAGELDLESLRGCSMVGLTAGTSTLDETVREVQSQLEALEPM